MRGNWNRTIAIAAFALVVLLGVLARPLLPVDETRYLAVAWEMYQNGAYFLLHKNGEIYIDKPPLLFWLINLVWSLTGVSATPARLVGPAFAVGCVILVGPLARRLWPQTPNVSERATWILAGFGVFAALGGLTLFDTMVAFATLLGIWSLVEALGHGRPQRRPLGWLGFGAAIALGVYAKGPVILVHLLPAALLFGVWMPPASRPPVKFVAGGLAVALVAALALVALWLVPALIAGGQEFAKEALWTQSAGRMAGSFAHARPFWYYFSVLPLLLFPWFWKPATWAALRAIPVRTDPGLRLCLVWLGAALIIFSGFSGKQLHYVLPELPAMAMLLARILPAELGRAGWKFAAIPLGLFAAAALIAPLGLIDVGKLENFLTPHAVIIAAGVLALALVVAGSRMPFLPGNAVLGLGIVLILNLVIGLTATRDNYDTTPIARSLARYDASGIAFYAQNYHAEFNFTGRLLHPVTELQAENDLNDWIDAHPDGAVVARMDRPHPDWPAAQEFLFRNRTYAVWSVAGSRTPPAPPQ